MQCHSTLRAIEHLSAISLPAPPVLHLVRASELATSRCNAEMHLQPEYLVRS